MKYEKNSLNRRRFLHNTFKVILLFLILTPKRLLGARSMAHPILFPNQAKKRSKHFKIFKKSNQLSSPKVFSISKTKELSLYNIHTGEWIRNCTFDAIPTTDFLKRIRSFFRDHRTDQMHDIDPKLLFMIQMMMQKIDASRPIHLVSGYRSIASNSYLRSRSSGVARNSYHTKGMAADIFVEGIANQRLQKIALSLRAGGVGRYDNFVHVDTGQFRKWGKM